jgi:hypothetical protein
MNAVGQFTLGDPKRGDRKHADGNQLRVVFEDEAVELVRKGWSIRVDGEGCNPPGLVCRYLYIDGIKVS